jgi:2-amino-4-hydroxy-6-hydroxymethyldihydropteridine diphosphokinase
MKYFIVAGSNLGCRASFVRRAVGELSRLGRVEGVSSLYLTEPVGDYGGWFYNLGAVLETSLSPFGLLSLCKHFERVYGRRGSGDRTLDVDIVRAGLSLRSRVLTLPHPHHEERNFTGTIKRELGLGSPAPVRGGKAWRLSEG